MSSRKRREARRVKLALKAYEQHRRDRARVSLNIAFRVREQRLVHLHGRYGATWKYLQWLLDTGRSIEDNGVDDQVILVHAGLTFRRV